MTPNLTKAELAARYVFNPDIGSLHVLDLVNQAKDGHYNKDILSSYAVGALLFAYKLGIIKGWEVSLFQVPFVRGGRPRSNMPIIGHPFNGPDGKVLRIDNVLLSGGLDDFEHVDEDLIVSPLSFDGVQASKRYRGWLREMIFGGRSQTSTIYTRTGILNKLKDIDGMVNGTPYIPGPGSVPQSTLHARLMPPGKLRTRRSRHRRNTSSVSSAKVESDGEGSSVPAKAEDGDEYKGDKDRSDEHDGDGDMGDENLAVSEGSYGGQVDKHEAKNAKVDEGSDGGIKSASANRAGDNKDDKDDSDEDANVERGFYKSLANSENQF